ncbi:MAG: hypothetical protein DRP66_02280 [Planctomycetota bacterium]|nr:MAG: hypothetical protein DRP66_02280 [Planctomycetota bacterium]
MVIARLLQKSCYYSTSRPTIKRKIAILSPIAEKQRAFACVKQRTEAAGMSYKMLQIRLKTGIFNRDQYSFAPVGIGLLQGCKEACERI